MQPVCYRTVCMEKFIMAGGKALHYTDSESGDKAVLLLHGYMESLHVWGDFADMLAEAGYRVIALDLPGHGISEVYGEMHTMEMLAATAAELLDKLSVEKVNVIGHSMGGYVALEMADKFPDILESLTLFSSTPNADTEEKKEDRRREMEIVRSGRKEMLSKVLPGKGFAPQNRKAMEEDIEDFALQLMLTENEGIVALLNGMMERKDMNLALTRLHIPQLFIFGKYDEYIPREVAESVMDKNPQAQVAWLENSGHNGFLEEPERSLEVIGGFLKSIVPSKC